MRQRGLRRLATTHGGSAPLTAASAARPEQARVARAGSSRHAVTLPIESEAAFDLLVDAHAQVADDSIERLPTVIVVNAFVRHFGNRLAKRLTFVHEDRSLFAWLARSRVQCQRI
jgi:hypothetical protein